MKNETKEEKDRRRELRKKAFEWHGKKCMRCGFEDWQNNMHVHHRHYRSVGNEQAEDVVVLCKGCHKDLHHASKTKRLTERDIPYVDPEWAEKLKGIR